VEVNLAFPEPQTSLDPGKASEKFFKRGGHSALERFREGTDVFKTNALESLQAALDFAAILFQDEEARRKSVGVGRRKRNHRKLADDGWAGHKTKNSCHDPES
jgi:hypothetical protein